MAAKGFDRLVDLWEIIGEGKGELPAQQFSDWTRDVRPLLTARESAFFDAPMKEGIGEYPDIVQTLMTGRMSKILMDRRGFKVAKEKGGLGL